MNSSIVNEIMNSQYIRLLKLPNLNGGFYFSVTTSRKLGAAGKAIGKYGYEILGRAYEERRAIYRTNLSDGTICYTIFKR